MHQFSTVFYLLKNLFLQLCFHFLSTLGSAFFTVEEEKVGNSDMRILITFSFPSFFFKKSDLHTVLQKSNENLDL